MKKSIAAIAALALVAGQATIASAATKDDSKVLKASVPSCAAPLKAAKVVKNGRVENRCDMDDHSGPFGVGVAPLVFGAAIVAGVVAVAVVTTDNNSATSP